MSLCIGYLKDSDIISNAFEKCNMLHLLTEQLTRTKPRTASRVCITLFMLIDETQNKGGKAFL